MQMLREKKTLQLMFDVCFSSCVKLFFFSPYTLSHFKLLVDCSHNLHKNSQVVIHNFISLKPLISLYINNVRSVFEQKQMYLIHQMSLVSSLFRFSFFVYCMRPQKLHNKLQYFNYFTITIVTKLSFDSIISNTV